MHPRSRRIALGLLVGASGCAPASPEARVALEPSASATTAASTNGAGTAASSSGDVDVGPTSAALPDAPSAARPRPKSYAAATISSSAAVVCTVAESIPECFRIDTGARVGLPVERAQAVAVAVETVCLLTEGESGGDVRCTAGSRFDTALLRGSKRIFSARYGEDLCAERADGTIQCTYRNGFAWTDKELGVQLAGPHRFDAVDGTVRLTNLYARSKSPFCWVDGETKQPRGCGLEPPQQAMLEISPHLYHTCGILSPSRHLLCWNGGMYGDTAWIRGAPRRFAVGPLRHLVDGTFGLRTDGSVLHWGDDPWSLDNGAATSVRDLQADRPSAVAPAGSFVALEGSLNHVCGVTPAGAIRCAGELALSNPQSVPGLTKVVELAAARDLTCARDEGGAVRCWGRPLGISGASLWSPVEIPEARGFTSLVVEPGAVCDATRCVVWVSDFERSVQARTSASPSPPSSNAPPIPADLQSATVVSGNQHRCALVDGSVSCWGSRGRGQLGGGYWHEVAPPLP